MLHGRFRMHRARAVFCLRRRSTKAGSGTWSATASSCSDDRRRPHPRLHRPPRRRGRPAHERRRRDPAPEAVPAPRGHGPLGDPGRPAGRRGRRLRGRAPPASSPKKRTSPPAPGTSWRISSIRPGSSSEAIRIYLARDLTDVPAPRAPRADGRGSGDRIPLDSPRRRRGRSPGRAGCTTRPPSSESLRPQRPGLTALPGLRPADAPWPAHPSQR